MSDFSPDLVTGGYAKTKAEATQLVLDASRQGLPSVVVHPWITIKFWLLLSAKRGFSVSNLQTSP